MTYFDVDELQLIVKKGDGEYDFSPEETFYQISIIKRINAISTDEVLDFLDYHFNDNQFQYLFAAIIYSYCKGPRWIEKRDVKELIGNWLDITFKLNQTMLDEIFEIMFDRGELDKNSRVRKLTANVDLYKKVEVLSFCTKISEESMIMHRKKYGITY